MLCACGAVAQPLTNVTFVVFDTETTGLRTTTDRVVEIGAVRIVGGVETGRKTWRINPGIPIPPEATRVHGITDAMVAKCPPFREVFPEVAAFFGNAVLVAHNARYDVRIVSAELARNGLSMPTNAVLDTLALARARYPQAPAHTVASLVKYLNLATGSFHRADSDAVHTAGIFAAATGTLGPYQTLQDVERACGGAIHFGETNAAPKAEDPPTAR
jgi:DNA polymerase III epsilon subunit